MTTFSSRASARQAFRGGPGNRLRQVEQVRVLLAAEILRAEQLLQADDLRARAGGLADAPLGFGQVLRRVGGAGHLDQTHAELGLEHKTIVAAAVGAPKKAVVPMHAQDVSHCRDAVAPRHRNSGPCRCSANGREGRITKTESECFPLLAINAGLSKNAD